MKGPLLLLLLVTVVESGPPSCGSADSCADPYANVKQLVACRMTDVISQAGLDKVLHAICTQLCQGSNTDQLTSHIKEILMKGMDLGTMGKFLAVLGPFTNCLKKNKATMDDVTNAASDAFKKQFTPLFGKASQIATGFKGKCTSPDLYAAMAKFGCPTLNKNMVLTFFQALKAELGAGFECFKTVLDNKVLYIGQYNL